MKKKKKNENSSKIFEYHDHGACFGDAITQIEDYFIQKKLQLTPLRRKVFEILIEDHKPLGAYEILEKLGKAGFSSKADDEGPVAGYDKVMGKKPIKRRRSGRK